MYRGLLVCFIAALALRAEPPGDLRALVRQSMAGLKNADGKLGEYGFVRAVERKELTSDGAVRKRQSWLNRQEPQDGFMVFRLIERDGQVISGEERRQNDESIAARVAELKAMTPEQRRKDEEENRRRTAENTSWLKEVPDALEYTLAGEETIHGRPAWILACEPRHGYRAKNLRARVFEKMRGRIWIDQQERELVRADVEMFDSVSVGWGVLGRIEKGTKFFLQRSRVGEGVWLPEAQTIRLSARMLLFKTLRSETTTRYSDYRHRSELEPVASRD